MAEAPSCSTRNVSPWSTMRDMTVVIWGMVTSFLTVGVLWYFEDRYDASLLGQMVGYVVPIGAMAGGALGATGYWIGARILHRRPSGWVLLAVLVVSLMSCLLLDVLHYNHDKFRSGEPVKQHLSFEQYLWKSLRSQVLITHERNSTKETRDPLSTGEGCFYALLRIFGFSFGGLLIVMQLDSAPYCERCLRYRTQHQRWTRYFYSVAEQQNIFAGILSLFRSGFMQEAVDLFLRSGVSFPTTMKDEIKFFRFRKVSLILEKRRCGKCGELAFEVEATLGQDQPVQKVKVKTLQPVRLPAAPPIFRMR